MMSAKEPRKTAHDEPRRGRKKEKIGVYSAFHNDVENWFLLARCLVAIGAKAGC